jgi:hypothetical protein
MRSALAALLALAVLAGCSSGETATLGLDEPLQVQGGSFHPGKLPGGDPIDVVPDGGAPLPSPHVNTVNSLNNILRPGQTDKALSGSVTDDSYAIGIRFQDLGTGYWVVPVGGPDPLAPESLTWSMSLSLSRAAPPGIHPMRFAAIDRNGRSGPQFELPFCITDNVPDNLNSCDPKLDPPAVVVALRWDADVDLDLVVVVPNGKVVDAKHSTTALAVDGGVTFDPATDGAVDRDSNANCVVDGIRQENLVWQGKPDPGDYFVFAHLADACAKDSVRFTATVYVSRPKGRNNALVPELEVSGELLAIDAKGDEGLGLFLTEFHLD